MTSLHILDHSVPVMSGYSSRSRSIVQFQARLGLRPVVLTSPKHGEGSDGVETIEGLPYYRTGRAGGGVPVLRELRQMLRMASRIVAVARLQRASLLHAHSPALNGVPALWAGRRLEIPVVYEARGLWEDAAVDHGTTREGSVRYRLSRALEGLVLRKADGVVTICEGMRQDFIRRGVSPDRVMVVPNGVDVDSFQPRPRDENLAQNLGLDGGPVFGFIGSFYRYEGLRFLVGAVPAIRRTLPKARFLLVGGGQEERALQAMAADLGEAVIFAGRVPHQRIRDFYSVIDVFVCPRRRMRLTELVTPLKPLEAMAMAVPVLASDVGGHAELIRHGETGLLFPAESAEEFVATAVRLASDGGLGRRLGEGARAYVARERTWAGLVSRYPELYLTLRSERSR